MKVSVEYVLSNGKVFPANFPVHLRTKIDRDNAEFMEESRERLRSRKANRVATRSKQRRMIEQYRGLKWQGIQGEAGDPNDILNQLIADYAIGTQSTPPTLRHPR